MTLHFGLPLNKLEVDTVYRCRLSNRKILIIKINLEATGHQTKVCGWFFNPVSGTFDTTSIQEKQLTTLETSVLSLGNLVE